MGTFIDLTGLKFGRLLVTSRAPNRKKSTMWNCVCCCDENTATVVNSTSLNAGKSKSCGCLRSELHLIELTGMQFGRLKVTSRATNDKYGSPMWNCVCACDKKTKIVVRGSNLRDGSSKSCGCFSVDRTIEERSSDLSGKQFGKLTVMSASGSTKHRQKIYYCYCSCQPDKTITVYGSSLITGHTKSCGCIQRGHAMELGRSKRGNKMSKPNTAKRLATRAANKTAKEAAKLPKWKTPRKPELEMSLLERLVLGLE